MKHSKKFIYNSPWQNEKLHNSVRYQGTASTDFETSLCNEILMLLLRHTKALKKYILFHSTFYHLHYTTEIVLCDA